jgi:hypothetical protein
VAFPKTGTAIAKKPLSVSLELVEDIPVYPDYLFSISQEPGRSHSAWVGDDDYTDVEWYVDDQTEPISTENYIYLYGADYTAKTHRLTVRGIKNGIPASRILTFTVY